MTAELVVVACVAVIAIAVIFAAAAFLVWKISELHDARLNNFADRLQAPEAAHIAAFEAALPARREQSASSYVDFPVLDEDFVLADIIEEK